MQKEQDKSLTEKGTTLLQAIQLLSLDPVRLANLRKKLFASADTRSNAFSEGTVSNQILSAIRKRN